MTGRSENRTPPHLLHSLSGSFTGSQVSTKAHEHFPPHLSQYRLTHLLLLLRTGHSPVIATVSAGPLVEP